MARKQKPEATGRHVSGCSKCCRPFMDVPIGAMVVYRGPQGLCRTCAERDCPPVLVLLAGRALDLPPSRRTTVHLALWPAHY